MKKKLLLIGLVSLFTVATSFADVAVQVIASSTVNNVPADFVGNNQFALLRPWEMDTPPSFVISAAPTMHVLTVNSANTMPALELKDHVAPNTGLSWFYYCNGLTFHYGAANTATVVFSGQINAAQPGGGVTCTCSGTACSTTATLTATRRIVMQ